MTDIMAVKTKLLNIDFNGFSKEKRFYNIIVKNAQFLDRVMLEKNPDYKQPICYVVYIKNKKIFCYKRSGKGGEKRLYDLFSIGIGGHIDDFDGTGEEAIINSLKREAEEELIELPKKFDPELLGFINDNNTEVGKVHIGLLYVVKLDEHIESDPHEAGEGKFMTLKELEEIKDKMETWSQIALDVIKERLK